MQTNPNSDMKAEERLIEQVSMEETKEGSGGIGLMIGLTVVMLGYFPFRYMLYSQGLGQQAPFIELMYVAVSTVILLYFLFRQDKTKWRVSFLFLTVTMMITALVTGWHLGMPRYHEAMLLLYLVPMVEELFFRGFVFTFFRKQYGWPLAVLLTTALFVFMHIGMEPAGLWQMAVLSLVCCLLMLVRGGLVMAVAFHAIWNHVAVGNGLLAYVDMEFGLTTFIMLLISLLGLYVILKVRNPHTFRVI